MVRTLLEVARRRLVPYVRRGRARAGAITCCFVGVDFLVRPLVRPRVAQSEKAIVRVGCFGISTLFKIAFSL